MMRKLVSVLLFLMVSLSLPARNGYRESIKLTTDRELYFTGEKIWFHATVSSMAKDELLSTILYLELYDQQYNSVVRGKYRITDNLATGCIEVPTAANTGNYLLRAYTHYSGNFHPQTQTTLLVSIINPLLPVQENEVRENNQLLVVPEGTSITAGIPARLAVRLVPYTGIEKDEIFIMSDSATPVASCKPFSNGMALLEFTPIKDENYKVVLKKHQGQKIIKPLQVAGEGISMSPVIRGNILKINWSGTIPAVKQSEYRLKILSQGGEILHDEPVDPANPFEVQLTDYPDQLAYCILSKGAEIIQVHTVYTGRTATGEITVRTDSVYRSREKVIADFRLPENFKGNLLVSVVYGASKSTRANQIPWYAAYNSAFFNGVMNRVTHIDTSTQQQIDALMILYSHFLKNTGVHNRETEPTLQFLPELRDAQLGGSVVYKNSRLPAADVNVYCSVLDSGNQVHVYKTAADGHFYFTLNHLLPGEHTVYLCPQANDSVELLIDSDFDSRYIESAGYIPFLPDTTDLRNLNRMFRNSQLNTAFPEFSIPEEDIVNFYPVPSWDPVHIINLVDFIEMPVMEEIFSEITPFTTIRKRSDRFYLQLYDERTRSTLDDPLVILDGIPFFDINQLMGIAPDLVQKITLTNRMVYLGDNTLNGVIRITTNTKNFAGLKLPAASRFVNFTGVNEQTTVAFPQHQESEKSRIPDFKTLLYWDPFVKPGETISFHTSDAKGEYTITVSGSDETGNYIGTSSFEVR